MSLLLPRWNLAFDAMRAEQAVAKAVLEAGPMEAPATIARVTLPGDTRRLRGIPCVARGVPGVSPGTDPLAYVNRSVRV